MVRPRFYTLILLLFLIVGGASLFTFFFRKNFSSQRQVLSTLIYNSTSGNAPHDSYKIIKLRSGQDILVEVYLLKAQDSKLISSFLLEKKRDLFYDFKSSVTNMLLANVDDDPEQEVLIPVLGSDLEPAIHVLKFSQDNKQFAIF